ncbi:MAG: aminotransferase class V-fold PLP-dependent enzyme [Gemmatimonadota bacterium]|nr:aminotransferase class V-fold PLP-dependent enzyme [Gemmatimonadota bacterium]
MTYDVHALREREFPWAARGDAIYLNNASTGPLPARTVAAQHAFNTLRAEPWRITDEDELSTIRRTRELCARLIGASLTEIALMVNTSYGINVAARALPLAAGDVVLTFDLEFPANVYPWMALERRGIRLERIPCVDGLPDEDSLIAALDRPGVRVVTVSWVAFATGYRVDLARLGRACRERNIFFVVDAIQGVGALALDVHSLDVDILACGGQKWLLSPWGSGFVYVREALVRNLEPVAVGWMATRSSDDFTRLTDYDPAWHDDARRFEVTTLPYQDFAAMNASLELLLELGPGAIEHHVVTLASLVVDWARSQRVVRLVTPADPAFRAGIVAVAPRDAVRVSERLARSGVKHALREGAIRLSPHCYNTAEELDRALRLVEAAS